jgi:tetratricopeptide (TPR) repeat protein
MPKRNWTYVEDPVALGARLREARRQAGMSQRALAFPGCTAVYICRIESGQRTPSLQVLRELAKRLGVREEFLLTGEATAPEEKDTLLEAEVALRLDQVELAEHLFTEALSYSPGDVARGRALAGLAQIAFHEGDLDTVVEQLEDARSLLGDDVAEHPHIEDTLGRAYAMRSEYEESIAVFERALERARSRGDESDEARFAVLLANALIDGRNLPRAEEVLGGAIARAREASNPTVRARLYWSQSRLNTARGNHDAAARYARKALAAIEATEHVQSAARAHHLLAYIEIERGNAEEALALLGQGLLLLEQGGTRFERALFQLEEARALVKLGRLEEARELAADVAAVLEETSTGDAVRSYGVLAEVFVVLGERDRALNLYELAIERADKWSSPFLREVYARMAQLLEDEGRKDEAYAVLKKALQLEAEVTRPVG